MTARDAAVSGDEVWPVILHRWAGLPAAERARLLRSLKPGCGAG